MVRKLALALATFLLVGVCVFGAGLVVDATVGPPQAIAVDSPCPAFTR